jgi:hypothetical protein
MCEKCLVWSLAHDQLFLLFSILLVFYYYYLLELCMMTKEGTLGIAIMLQLPLFPSPVGVGMGSLWSRSTILGLDRQGSPAKSQAPAPSQRLLPTCSCLFMFLGLSHGSFEGFVSFFNSRSVMFANELAL